ncbi:FKBP-type peptidyl-prolyl cis-trans isomerase [Runella sp.]|jgi:FKBP-type peptidyl-prolyl cis-trans isomerase|uniref:FKBP-type peptidyl-prolyl cis-trans isomerase n=1 Tax=Runella sp. TaxID=1960881 RepID=UPI00261DEBB5|nr:FKBP-type peptidyl-prolyl cis-trans isomerase [Runella sp.]
MRGKLILGIIASLTVTIMACEQTEDVYKDRKTGENKAEIRTYLTANKLTADSTKSGLFYIIKNTNAAAQKPLIGDEVTLRYTAKRLDGTIVDSSQVGVDDVFIRSYSSRDVSGLMLYRFNPVPSFEELLSTPLEVVHEGDVITLFVPWSLRGTGDVSLLAPLYIPIRYDVEILKVRTEEEQINDYVAKNKILGLERNNDNGLRFVKTLAYPDSAQIAIGTTVSVTYTGRLIRNGKQFDTGTIDVNVVDPTGTASGGVVKGFNDGIAKMRYGEKAVIIFPSILGYGVTGSSTKIPAYSPLLFEVEAKRK